MLIGFDGKRAIQNHTGLGNYSRYVVEILAKYHPENTYILFTPKFKKNNKLERLQSTYSNLKIILPTDYFWKRLSAIWRIWRMGKSIELNNVLKFHGLSNELPFRIRKFRFKKIVTIHDLIFLRYPQYYKYFDRKIYAYKFRKACENADLVIAVSECTKRDIIHFFHIPEEKIEVIYQGCDHSFSLPVDDAKLEGVCKKHNLPQRFILNVGSIEERKNALLITQSLLYLPDDIHLVIVGRRTPYTAQIDSFVSENKLEERVHILNNIPTEDLPAIYQQAEIFAYPSKYEGFGIPIIEALHSGVPVVAATGSCLEEAGGPDSIYVHPNNVKDFAGACLQIVENEELKRVMIAKGKEYVKRFNDQSIANQLIKAYQ